jgi:FAD/FMN-containing dehydrogenase
LLAEVSAVSAARELSARLNPDRVLVSGAAYEDARRIWNGAVENRPALIVRCGTTSDVQAAILAARRHALPLSVRGGGHDWAGRALRHAGLVIDLSRMRQVAVDAAARIATVAGGATTGDVVAATTPHELAAATGTVRSVGMAGLTLGGGYGPLDGRLGLALDNLLGAEVVLADGRLVTADSTHEPQLYWALRGGGGNFGVVTSMRIRLHPIHQMLAGFIIYPWSQATDAWGGLSAVVAAAPDELTVQSGMLSDQDGSPTLFVSPTWSGDLAKGEKPIDELQRLHRGRHLSTRRGGLRSTVVATRHLHSPFPRRFRTSSHRKHRVRHSAGPPDVRDSRSLGAEQRRSRPPPSMGGFRLDRTRPWCIARRLRQSTRA